MRETLEACKRRLIDDGWFDRLHKRGTQETACHRCGYLTNNHGECICHDADRQGMSVPDLLAYLGRLEPDQRFKRNLLSDKPHGGCMVVDWGGWHLTADELPPVRTPVEAVWCDGYEPTNLIFYNDNRWFDWMMGHGVPVPLKWREIEE